MLKSNDRRLQPDQSETSSEAVWPLGAHLDHINGETTFAVHAPAASKVVLEIYPTATGSDPTSEIDLARCGDDIWVGALSGAPVGTLYAFRCWGRNWPFDPRWRRGGSRAGFLGDRDVDGNRFNPNKVLFDPYAREITHTPLSAAVRRAGASHLAFGTGSMPHRGRPGREIDTGRFAPKGVVIDDDTPTGLRPSATGLNPAIYEAHVKNLTMHPSSARLSDLLGGVPGFEDVVNVPDALRGTYAGAAYIAPYLRALGFTAIELMPVHETDTDHAGAESGTTNHWGYQTLGFFAPNRDYSFDQSPGGPTREFKGMVRRFHDEGIEVLLDVVYNHTAEGGHWYNDINASGFTTLGGFATADYYVMTSGGRLIDGATGTSNQMNFSSPASRRLVLDSLTYWNQTMGVDGFRFDLAPVLGRHPHEAHPDDLGRQKRFFSDHPLLMSVRDLSIINDFEIIAEPWDLWGYEVGNFPTGWLEWNGRFRDATRRFLKGDGNAKEFIQHLNGNSVRHGCGQLRSINFIDAHDGFTLMDLVSFNTKHNGQRHPFGPSDGGEDNNLSWDSDLDQRLRRARWRNEWLLVFAARGVPMVLSGDEYGRTQNGNNNPWDLNTIGLWNNWAQAASNAPTRVPVDPANPGPKGPSYYDVIGPTDAKEGINPLLMFARCVARMRRGDPGMRHGPWGGVPGANQRPHRFLRPDLAGFPQDGDRALTVAVDGSTVGGSDYVVLINMWIEPISFTVPDPCFKVVRPPLGRTTRGRRHWRRVIDTAPWAERFWNCWDPEEAPVAEGTYLVEPWSMVLLLAVDAEPPIPPRRGLVTT